MIELKTKEELVEFLKKYKSATEIAVRTKTAVKMNKKDVATKKIPNPLSEAYKITNFKADINFDYEDRVNDARLVEGKEMSFEAQQAKWGTFVSKSLNEKDGNFYLKLIPKDKIGATTYCKADGELVDYLALDPFIPKPAAKKPSGQGLENPVPYRTYKLDSIIYIEIPGVMTYTAQ